MRIGFCGAGGTGKSTLAQMIATPTHPYVPSVVRSVFERWGIANENDQLLMTPQKRLELQYEIWVAKGNNDERFRDGIFDRTPIDHYVYTLFRCYDAINENDLKRFETWLKIGVRQYDLIFYCSARDFVSLNDTVRVPSLGYAYMIDSLIRGVIDEYRIEIYDLPMDNLDARENYVMETIMKQRLGDL